MEFTTHLGLHSQTTRLDGSHLCCDSAAPNGALTLSGVPFQGTSEQRTQGDSSSYMRFGLTTTRNLSSGRLDSFIELSLQPLENLANAYAFSFVANWTSLSSMDSDLEAISHNPTDGSFTALATQPTVLTNYLNQLFLSYLVGLLSRYLFISRVKLTCLSTV